MIARVLLLVAGLFVAAFAMAAAGILWGSSDGIGVLFLGLIVVCLVGGPILKWYFERQDRA